jgi:uncharacterized protein (TIGR02145 family)
VAGLTASLASGNFTNGSGNLLLNITGTPQSNGNATFSLSIGGQNCSFAIPVLGGSVETLNCDNPIVTGDFVEDIAVNNGLVAIPYTNGFGSYNAQNIYSTGVVGLQASLDGENFVGGGGNLNFAITGTPQSVGIASFSLSIGGQECTFSIAVEEANVSSLNCNNAVISGDFFDGVPVNNASISISYSNGIGNYGSQIFNSSGITGLTASMPSGTFQSGVGTIFLTVSGTPSQPGVAYFNLSIGGQTCIVQVAILDATEHTCGTSGIHNPNLEYGSMTDQEGNDYKTIVIGTQEWMAENLNTGIYRNGDAIPIMTPVNWQSATSGSCASYNGDNNFECPYGKLYNWYACVDSRQLCPLGWHMPTDAEWSLLINYLGGENTAGGQLKSAGTSFWTGSNTSATNITGFSGLPGGYRSFSGLFSQLNQGGYWWSSSAFDADYAWGRYLRFNEGFVNHNNSIKQMGKSVRCIRNL